MEHCSSCVLEIASDKKKILCSLKNQNFFRPAMSQHHDAGPYSSQVNTVNTPLPASLRYIFEDTAAPLRRSLSKILLLNQSLLLS
jgi:hypothetical protein